MKDGSDINKLRLVSSVGGRLCTLFDEPEVKYVIPLYQRSHGEWRSIVIVRMRLSKCWMMSWI